MKNAPTVIAAGLLLLVPGARADLVLTMTGRDADGNTMADNTIYIQGEQIRLDNAGGVSGHMSMIFRGDEMIVLNIDEQEYYHLDEATLQRFSERMSGAMAQMQQQMANMPPEQRAIMERMMMGQAQSLGGTPKPPLRVEAGGAGSFENYECTNYTVYIGMEKSQEVCAASLGQIEGLSELKTAFGKMSDFLQKMTATFGAGPLANVGKTPMDLVSQIDGFPVHSRNFENGQAVQEVYLTSVSSNSVDASVFEIPAGYREHEVMPPN